jgi:hypothetical protein
VGIAGITKIFLYGYCYSKAGKYEAEVKKISFKFDNFAVILGPGAVAKCQ